MRLKGGAQAVAVKRHLLDYAAWKVGRRPVTE